MNGLFNKIYSAYSVISNEIMKPLNNLFQLVILSLILR